MAEKNDSVNEVTERELVLTRIIDAPRELVFQAWTDPKHMAKWWGPKDFTNPVCELDVRPGGAWHIDMRGPDGTIYPCQGIYQEVVPNERLVYTAVSNANSIWGDKPPDAVHIITFEDDNGKTKLTTITKLKSVADRDAMLKMKAVEGWTQSLERLEAVIAQLAS